MKRTLRLWPIGLVLLGTMVIVEAQQPVRVTNTPLSATQSGTWTVQPGNTANTTPWLLQIRDAAGNARGANVDASNRLSTLASAVDSGNNDATNTVAHTVKVTAYDATGTAIPVSDGGSGASSANTARVIQATDSITNAVPTASATLGGASNYAAFQTSGAVLTAQIKGSAGQVYDVDCTSVAAAATFVRLYNQTGAPASTDGANIVWRGVIPGATTGAGFMKQIAVGRAFSTGVGIRITGAIADNDTTVLSANTVMCNVGYK